MKPDSERTRYYFAKKHEKRAWLHAHLSKELRAKLKAKKRALLLHKGDTVKVMRGSSRGKTAKVARVSVNRRVVFLEGMSVRNRRGKEALVPFQPSNLLLTGLEATDLRKKLFSDEAFKKAEAKKEAPKEEKKTEAPAKKEEQKAHEAAAHGHEGHAHEHKVHEAQHTHAPHEHGTGHAPHGAPAQKNDTSKR